MARRSWQPLPAVTVLSGSADFLKETVVKRFAAELFHSEAPDLRRFEAGGERQAEQLSLATVLDELRTPSFFSAHRMVRDYVERVYMPAAGRKA